MLFTVYSRYVPKLKRKDGLAFSGLVHGAPINKQDDWAEQALTRLPPERLRELMARVLGSN